METLDYLNAHYLTLNFGFLLRMAVIWFTLATFIALLTTKRLDGPLRMIPASTLVIVLSPILFGVFIIAVILYGLPMFIRGFQDNLFKSKATDGPGIVSDSDLADALKKGGNRHG